MSANFEIALVFKAIDQTGAPTASVVRGLNSVAQKSRELLGTSAATSRGASEAAKTASQAIRQVSTTSVASVDQMASKASVGAASAASRSMETVGRAVAKSTGQLQGAGTAAMGAWSKATSGIVTFEGRADRAAQAVRRLGKEAQDSANRAGNSMRRAALDIEKVKRGLDSGGNKAAIAGGALAAGMGIHTAVRDSFDAGHKQAALANIADLSPEAQKAMAVAVRSEVKHTNQSVMELTEGLGVLMGAGWDDTKALAAIRGIGRAATATQSSVDDLSRTALAGVDNLKVPVQQVGRYLDVLARAGKEGNYELRDMSKDFPSLGAKAGKLGITGLEGTSQVAAALQVARMGAGTSAEAGTNTINFLDKLTAPETNRNFAKFGVSLEQEFAKARASGDVIAYMGSLIQRVTKGNDFRLGELFGDLQVKGFLTPFLANLDKYRAIQGKSLGANGVVDKDFARMMETPTEKWKRFRNQVSVTVMPRIEPWLERLNALLDKLAKHPMILDGLITAVVVLVGGGLLSKAAGQLLEFGGAAKKAFQWFAPGLANRVNLAEGGFKALGRQVLRLGENAAATNSKLVQMDLARFGFSPSALSIKDKLRMGFSTDWMNPATYSAPARKLGKGLISGLKAPFGKSFWQTAWGGMKSLKLPMPALSGANSLFSGFGLKGAFTGMGGALKAALLLPFKGIGAVIAAVGLPVIAIIAAIAVAALLIYKYWEPIKAFFSGIWQGFKENLDLVMPAWSAFSDAVAGVFKALVSLVDIFLPVQSGQEGVNGAMEKGKAIGEGLAWVLGIVLTAAKWVAQGVEALVIVIASLGDLLITNIIAPFKAVWAAVTALWDGKGIKAAGKAFAGSLGESYGGMGDRFRKRLENSSMNPDKPAQAMEKAGAPGKAAAPPPKEEAPGSPAKPSAEGEGKPAPKIDYIKLIGPPPGTTQSAPVQVNYSPTIKLEGNAGPEDEARILKILDRHKHEVAAMVETVLERQGKWNGRK